MKRKPAGGKGKKITSKKETSVFTFVPPVGSYEGTGSVSQFTRDGWEKVSR